MDDPPTIPKSPAKPHYVPGMPGIGPSQDDGQQAQQLLESVLENIPYEQMAAGENNEEYVLAVDGLQASSIETQKLESLSSDFEAGPSYRKAAALKHAALRRMKQLGASDVDVHRVRYELATLYYKAQMYDDSEFQLKELLSSDPDNEHIRDYLSEVRFARYMVELDW